MRKLRDCIILKGCEGITYLNHGAALLTTANSIKIRLRLGKANPGQENCSVTKKRRGLWM
ncbi:hypothetical protein ES703_14404 [subsurface metagenome]